MTKFYIVTGETRFEMGTRPGIRGLGVRISGVRGSFEVTVNADDTIDLTQPAHGWYTLLVDELRTSNKIVTVGVREWLGQKDGTAVTGAITEFRPRDDGRYDFIMTVTTRERKVPLKGTGRITRRPSGRYEAVGSTIADPRAFGVPLPPLLNLMVHVRWRLLLEARDDLGDPDHEPDE